MTAAEPASPAVSLVVITYNRAARLAETLRAVQAQTLPADQLEVIVVDDGPADATRQVVQYGPIAGARYLTQTRQGATRARNFGAQHARGRLLVFLDDDIELGPATLARLAAAHTQHPRAVIVGALLNPGDPWPSQAGVVAAPFTECYTGLLSVGAAEFAALGGFQDVTGGWPNWDDVEFGYRVQATGRPLLRCRDAWAVHHDASAGSLAATARRSMAAAQSAARLFQAHPGIRGQLPMFADKEPLAWGRDGPQLTARKLLRHVTSAWPVLHGLEWLEARAPQARWSAALRRWIVGGYLWQGYRRGLREL
jgi:GT2 family glycosyltransferase